ncbi:phd-finger domain-containing protein [Ceratocystis lukuohia]|uniref:Phd-finger domain-containing protein n=1 Tax=Ceratocystis lukuohia TaxID=2019550 RepID=A0ABR4ML10_9PEZI
MAPLSPRRSSRARIPNNNLPTNPVSSAAAIASSRPERTTRSNRPSSTKSTPSASLSSESPDDYDDIHILRSSRRRGPDDDSSTPNSKSRPSRRDNTTSITVANMANHNNEEIQEDDEAVRCVCGFDDYPGPPPLPAPQVSDAASTPSASTKRSRERDSGSDSEFINGIEVNEDVSGFYVQCDVCKVWQHGACVGIMTEESSPDEYYCEKCRKDLHKIHIATNGQRYSHYTYATIVSRSTSRAAVGSKDREKDKDGTSRSGRLSTASQTAKRRSTMNSRDAAYDEEEELRRAIEASKEDAPVVETSDNSSRRLKRGRSHSEDTAKRLRTSSPSVSPPTEKSGPSPDDSEDSSSARNVKRSRQSRSQRENLERQQKERQRQDAANKRRVRADRRRADGSTWRDSEKDDYSADSKEPDEPSAKAEAVAKAIVPDNTEPASIAAESDRIADVEASAATAPTTAAAPAADAAAAAADVAVNEISQTPDKATTKTTPPSTTAPTETSMDVPEKKPSDKRTIEKSEPETEKAPIKTTEISSAAASPAPFIPVVIKTPDTPPTTALALPTCAPTPISEVALAAAPATAPAVSVKKTSKTGKKGRGRNQYTRDRDEIEDSPVRSTRESRHKSAAAAAAAAQQDNYSSHSSTSNGHNNHNSGNGTSSRGSRHTHDSKSSKSKSSVGKLSIPELKRRSAAFLDFIQKTQLELAAEATPSRSGSSSDDEGREVSLEERRAGDGKGGNRGREREGTAVPGTRQGTPEPSTARKDFGDLSCGEMMDVLTRDLLKWQNQYLS